MALHIILFSVFSFCAVDVLSDDNHDILHHFKGQIDECMKEIRVDRALVESFLKENVFSEDKNFKCFLHCLQIKLNVINENGDVNIEEMKNVIFPFVEDKEKAAAEIEKCSKIKEDDKCETSFEMVKCLSTK
ncbi:hypothetical protein FQR65_LT09971 [Abscondita terminalis]|nr:hypothetical protein FQR65_LT09971 [Abscondita terminalis]